MVNIYKFHKKEILIQPPGEPREQRLGDVRQKSLSNTKFHKFHTGRVEIYWRIFGANFIWLLSFKISQLETLKLLEVLVTIKLFITEKVAWKTTRKKYF